MARYPRGLTSITRWTAWRTRPSSIKPLTRQHLKSDLASRRDCLVIFMVLTDSDGDLFCGFFSQTPLVIRRQNLAGYRGRGLNHQPADLAFQLRQHARVVLAGRFPRLDKDLLGGGDGFLGFLFLHP